MSDEPRGLVPLDQLRQWLAQAASIDEVREVRDQAEAIRLYRKNAGHGQAMQNHAAEIKIRSERRIGELLAEQVQHQGGRPLEKRSQAGTVSPATLKDLGFTKNDSSRYQQMARVPEPDFEQHLAEEKAKEHAELTSAKVLEKAKELQQKERRRAREEREAVQRARPILPLPVDVQLLRALATELPLGDESVHLIVTSPGYGLLKPYHGITDLAEGWPRFTLEWLREAYRVGKPGARMALNVPLDTSEPVERPCYAQAVMAALEAGWTYQATVIWNKDNISKSTARGSVDSYTAPHVIARVEMIALFSKGEWKQPKRGASDLTHDEWMDWTDGLWTFPGESHGWEGHPAPFPEELPRRLITLLSGRGDVVLDPFVGSGTTVVVAHRLGRKAIGCDQSAQYMASATRRLGGGGN